MSCPVDRRLWVPPPTRVDWMERRVQRLFDREGWELAVGWYPPQLVERGAVVVPYVAPMG